MFYLSAPWAFSEQRSHKKAIVNARDKSNVTKPIARKDGASIVAVRLPSGTPRRFTLHGPDVMG